MCHSVFMDATIISLLLYWRWKVFMDGESYIKNKEPQIYHCGVANK